MALEIRDPETGQIKMWVWIAAGGGLVLLFLVVSRMQSSTSSSVVSGGQSSDISGQLDSLNEAIIGLTDVMQQPPPPITQPPNTVPIPPITTQPPEGSGGPGPTIDPVPPTTLPPITQPPVTTTTVTPLGYFNYTVQKGDTLSGLAQRFNVGGIQRLLAINPKITDPNLIRTGSTIKIPVRQPGSVWNATLLQFTTITTSITGALTGVISAVTGTSNVPAS